MGNSFARRRLAFWLAALLAGPCCFGPAPAWADPESPPNENQIVVRPVEYPHALRNPLKGFRPDTNAQRNKNHQYAALTRCYIKWNDLENIESDGVQRIRDYCNRRWRDVEKYNLKVIPRVYLDWDKKKGNEYWPADMRTGDYSSEQFKRRVVRLVDRLGQCWDQDPRVAWVQLAIIGYWGEHHHPSPDAAMQKLLGDAFTKAFRRKLVVVRHPWEFTDYQFGIHWDSWAHIQQMNSHGAGIAKLNAETGRWKMRPIEGEVAYDWGRHDEQPGANPDDTLRDSRHREYLIDVIRQLHCSGLGWVANYDPSDPGVRAGAEEVQKVLGYRFVLDEASFPAAIDPGQPFTVRFNVRNTGSAPFYYPWPVEISLLDGESHEAVWRDRFTGVDIRRWLPGDRWSWEKGVYEAQPPARSICGDFTLPAAVPRGRYILALAILDPAGMLPSVRFATANYLRGGLCPLGYVGVGARVDRLRLDPAIFDDPAADRTLHYELSPDSAALPFHTNPKRKRGNTFRPSPR